MLRKMAYAQITLAMLAIWAALAVHFFPHITIAGLTIDKGQGWSIVALIVSALIAVTVSKAG